MGVDSGDSKRENSKRGISENNKRSIKNIERIEHREKVGRQQEINRISRECNENIKCSWVWGIRRTGVEVKVEG